MKKYLIHYVQTTADNGEIDLYWRCDADDYSHAVEQLKDEVEHAEGEKLLFHELLKCEK